jgi:hypothetical protein
LRGYSAFAIVLGAVPRKGDRQDAVVAIVFFFKKTTGAVSSGYVAGGYVPIKEGCAG